MYFKNVFIASSLQPRSFPLHLLQIIEELMILCVFPKVAKVPSLQLVKYDYFIFKVNIQS